eukprot:g1359.t1
MSGKGRGRAESHDSPLSPRFAKQNLLKKGGSPRSSKRAPRSLLSWSAINPFNHKDSLNHHDEVATLADSLLYGEDDVMSKSERGESEQSPHSMSESIDSTISTGGKSGRLSVTMNFVNSVVGSGIIGLPYVFRIAGFYMGFILLAAGCLLTDYSVRLLVRTGMIHGQRNYEDLCHYALGTPGTVLVSVAMLIFDFGAMLSYLIIMGDAGTNVVQHTFHFHDDSDETIRRITIIVLSVALILPLCLFRDISKLEKASTFSVATVTLVIGVVLYEFGKKGIAEGAGKLEFVAEESGFISAFGIVAFAFVCHDSSFLLSNTLKDNHVPGRWSFVTHTSLVAALLICLTLAVPGYLTFRDNTCANLLNNYDMSGPIVFMRVVFVLTMALTYPISFFVVRHITNVSLFGGRDSFESIQDMPLQRHLLLTVPIFLITVVIVMFVKNLGDVMAVAGSMGGGLLAFVLPPLCNIVVSKYSILFWRNHGHVWDSVRTLGPPLALLIFGISVIPLTVYETLRGANNECKV